MRLIGKFVLTGFLLALSFSTFAQDIFDEKAVEEEILPSFEEIAQEDFDYAEADTILRVAVVLSDIYSKKDMEFARGMLLGIRNAGLPANSVSIKMVNGEITADSLQFELENFEPHVIIETFDKEMPHLLLAYTQTHGNKLVNVFDAKGGEYLYNKGVYQLLSPSEVFNANVSEFFTANFPGNELLMVGDPDTSENMIRDLIVAWPEDDLLIVTKEDLPLFSLDGDANYLICPVYSSAQDVKETLSEVTRMISETPSAGVRIIGRPNWVAFNDLSSMIANMEAFIPARCYFDPSNPESRQFITEYNEEFGHTPIRSYPVYAVMGYDTASFFLPEFLSGLRGNPDSQIAADLLQSYFNMKQSGYSGFYNTGNYMLHYEPWGTMKKLLN